MYKYIFFLLCMQAFSSKIIQHSLFRSHSRHFSLEKNQKLISISPGGYKGFYMLGICKYIKETYDLSNYAFSGASAGAWNALMLCYKYDTQSILNRIITNSLQDEKSIYAMENQIKRNIITHCKISDFNLNKLYIGITAIEQFKPTTIIHSNFNSLPDALDCCIASSHIPFITGGLTSVYRNKYSFDGGFSKYPYLQGIKPVLHITPSLWSNKSGNATSFKMTDYTTLFSKDLYRFSDLIDLGYDTAKNHRQDLDSLFL